MPAFLQSVPKLWAAKTSRDWSGLQGGALAQAISRASSSRGRTRKRFSRYIAQKVQRLYEQPMVACRIRLSASEGGR